MKELPAGFMVKPKAGLPAGFVVKKKQNFADKAFGPIFSFAHGAARGFAEEAAAAGGQAVRAVQGLPTGREAYEEDLAGMRAMGKQFEEQNPAASLGLRVAGALPSSLLIKAPPIVAGAAEGAVQGFGEAQGGVQERLQGIGAGGALGGAFGAAGKGIAQGIRTVSPAVGAVAKGSVDLAGKAVRGTIDAAKRIGEQQTPAAVAKQVAAETIQPIMSIGAFAGDVASDVAQRQVTSKLPNSLRGLSDSDQFVAARLLDANSDVKKLLKTYNAAKAQGLEIPLYELADEGTLRNLGQLVREVGAGSTVARDTTTNLERQVPAAISRLVDRVAGSNAPLEAKGAAIRDAAGQVIKAADLRLKARAAPFYKKSVSANILVPEESISPIMNNTLAREAIEAAKSDKIVLQRIQDELGIDGATVTSAPNNSTAVLHAAQQKLRLDAESAAPSAKSVYNNARNEILKVLDQNQNYKIARAFYADDIGQLKKLRESPVSIIASLADGKTSEAGKILFNRTPMEIRQIANEVKKVDGGQDALRQAAAAHIENTFANNVDNQFAGLKNKLFGRPADRMKFKEILGARETVEVERFFDSFDRVISAKQALGNSSTAARQIAANALGAGDMAAGARAVQGGLNVVSIAQNIANSTREMAQNRLIQDPAFAKRLAELLMTNEGIGLLQKVGKAQANQEIIKAIGKQNAEDLGKVSIAVLAALGEEAPKVMKDVQKTNPAFFQYLYGLSATNLQQE